MMYRSLLRVRPCPSHHPTAKALRPNPRPSLALLRCRLADEMKSSDFATEEEKKIFIAKRIEESRKKRADRQFYYCPACRGGIGTRQKFILHLRRCCKDLLTHYKLTDVENNEKFTEFLQVINSTETELKAKALFLRYNDPSRSQHRTIAEVAETMGLPENRTERMMKKALRGIPLTKDNIPIEVLHEDEWLVAAMKPAYLITAPKHRFLGGTLFSRVYGYLGREPFGLHRLDMNTTGVVIFAKDPQSAERVNAQFREKTVRKNYLAICLGSPKEKEFTVETLIDTDPDHEIAQSVSETDGRWSKTSFRVLDSTENVSLMNQSTAAGSNFKTPEEITGACLLLCTPLTGRTHQIRLHVAHQGHAIIGDDIYGVSGPWIARQALHAFKIEFKHPATGDDIAIRAPPPSDFHSALDTLGLQFPPELI